MKIVWNKGLTKETDIRIKKMAISKTGIHHTKETKEKIKDALMGDKNPFYGKHHTKESKEMMKKNGTGHLRKGKTYEEIYGKERAKIIADKISNNNPKYMFGKHLSEKAKEKLKILQSGKNNSMFGKNKEKHWNWRGGKSFEPYTFEFNNKFKLLIKKRDRFMCLKCGVKEKDHLNLFGRREEIHHIDYIKENTSLQNCCVLCRKCNIEVNLNREKWTKYFQALLSTRYSYKY